MRPALLLIMSPALAACTNLHADSGSAPAVPVVSLCEVAANPAQWKGRVVRMRAVFLSDLMHTSILKDETCPNVRLGPFDGAVEPADKSAYEKWTVALYGDLRDMSLRVFAIDVVGRVEWDQTDRTPGQLHMIRVMSFRRLPDPYREN